MTTIMTTIRGRKRPGLSIVSSILAAAGLMLGSGLTGFFSSSAMAAALNFSISAPTAGTISYDGSYDGPGGGLVGTNIEVDHVVGLLTPANANVTSLCLSCVLNFTSNGYNDNGYNGNGNGYNGNGYNGNGNGYNGNGNGYNGNGWWGYGSGGAITITGGVQLQGSSDIPLGSTLLSGTFTSAFVQNLDSQGIQGFKVLFGSFSTDSKHPDLLAYYGITPSPFDGGLTLLFGSEGVCCEALTSTSIFGGSVVNAPVPVPAALWLFGSGLIGLAGVRKWVA